MHQIHYTFAGDLYTFIVNLIYRRRHTRFCSFIQPLKIFQFMLLSALLYRTDFIVYIYRYIYNLNCATQIEKH